MQECYVIKNRALTKKPESDLLPGLYINEFFGGIKT